ncbi:unnamed protein product [Dibothriocephalus latus]|uniref:Uncharacterized protein n=1 Tax=Dibothriocephalus latus TaxID=60516 RepID=A0A3P6SZH6_DIBLA|nr:unnamed protein product [Dibothriocephalus latus]
MDALIVKISESDADSQAIIASITTPCSDHQRCPLWCTGGRVATTLGVPAQLLSMVVSDERFGENPKREAETSI